jgi:heme a synthase
MATTSHVAKAPPATAAFLRYAWAVVVWNVLVVLWGAYVRATSSGAGCGSHWPLCNGVVIPRAATAATLIEFTHRTTSGLALLSVVLLFVWALRVYPAAHRVRRAALLSLVFIVIEALLGAGLVLFRLVAENSSAARAVYLSAHLANTLVLLGLLAATAFLAGKPDMRLRIRRGPVILFTALAIAMVVSITGAIAALGDTLFPAATLAAGLRDEFAGSAHILQRLRIVHPAIAVLGGALIAFAALGTVRHSALARRIALAVLALVFAQLVAGAINVLLLAPVWMQLVHLLLADVLWIALVLLTLQVADRIPSVKRAPGMHLPTY